MIRDGGRGDAIAARSGTENGIANTLLPLNRDAEPGIYYLPGFLC